DPNDCRQSVVTFLRCSETADNYIIVVCNFTPVVRHNYRIGVPHPGAYREIFNSDWPQYGGSGQANDGMLTAAEIPWHNQPYSLNLTIPPLAALYLKRMQREEVQWDNKSLSP
ncbi:MAG: alpha amylase C-terminal domain-containing protein, partial [Negativicutes bacterium]|nr:alpha amylase C-terminal domain-containing protein [Negativicutes bacterium]